MLLRVAPWTYDFVEVRKEDKHIATSIDFNLPDLKKHQCIGIKRDEMMSFAALENARIFTENNDFIKKLFKYPTKPCVSKAGKHDLTLIGFPRLPAEKWRMWPFNKFHDRSREPSLTKHLALTHRPHAPHAVGPRANPCGRSSLVPTWP